MQWSKDTRHLWYTLAALTGVLTIAGFVISPAAGLLMLCAAGLFGAAFALYLRGRNRALQRMTREIDTVLHNTEHLYICDSDEGELAVLQSEIVKMTRRIREQNAALMGEKAYLADSLTAIAHQLRTPLTSLNMVLSFLETCDDPGERKALCREAETLLLRVDGLLTMLLKLSRLDAGVISLQPTPVSVAALVDNALQPLQIPMELLHVTVTTELPANAVITADRVWLSEALQNLLKNCMESAGEQGEIRIHCEDTPLYTLLTIRDSGSGFREEELPHLFERFYRGKSTTKSGFGIGLALAKTVVDRHGGLLTAENHPEGGAVFTLKLYK